MGTLAASAALGPFPGETVLCDGGVRGAGVCRMALDSDRLLHAFRLTAGIPSNAEQLGGWERPDIELRGTSRGRIFRRVA